MSGGRHLTLEQVCDLTAALTQDNGRASVAAAVALAESGGWTGARNSNRDARGKVTSIDRGLWQINDRWHPDVTTTVADDPVASTQAAFRISKGFSDFTPWSAYKNQSYLRFWPLTRGTVKERRDRGLVGDVTDAGKFLIDPTGLGGKVIDGGLGAVKASLSVGEFLAVLGERRTWVRVVMVVGGLGSIVVGAFLLNADVVKGVAASAIDLVPGGKVAKVAAAGVAKSVD